MVMNAVLWYNYIDKNTWPTRECRLLIGYFITASLIHDCRKTVNFKKQSIHSSKFHGLHTWMFSWLKSWSPYLPEGFLSCDCNKLIYYLLQDLKSNNRVNVMGWPKRPAAWIQILMTWVEALLTVGSNQRQPTSDL